MYEKILETKIIRTKHKVSFTQGIRARDLIDYLANVPHSAKITDWYEGDDEGTSDPYIIFEEEKVTK